MTPVIRIDDEVMSELKKLAVELDLVFEPPNAILRRVLGLDTEVITREVTGNATQSLRTHNGKPQRFGSVHVATAVRDTVTGRVYPSKYRAGLEFNSEFPNIGKKYLWYQAIRKYPGKFVEVVTGKVL